MPHMVAVSWLTHTLDTI